MCTYHVDVDAPVIARRDYPCGHPLAGLRGLLRDDLNVEVHGAMAGAESGVDVCLGRALAPHVVAFPT